MSEARDNSTASILRVGLTGGIASGKSVVAELFAQLGVPIIDADQVARDVVEPGTPALAQIVATFGSGVLDDTGHLDRRKMRERVFTDPAARQQLEAISHPAIRTEMQTRSANAGGPYQLSVVPLLVENDLAETFDYVLVVDCPEQEQLRRLQLRDATDRAPAQRMLDAQTTRAQRLSVADDVIVNSGKLDELAPQVQRLHEKYLKAVGDRLEAIGNRLGTGDWR